MYLSGAGIGTIRITTGNLRGESQFGPSAGDFKVLRGGSWLSDEKYARVTYRSKTSPGNCSLSDGFRVVRVIQPKK